MILGIFVLLLVLKLNLTLLGLAVKSFMLPITMFLIVVL